MDLQQEFDLAIKESFFTVKKSTSTKIEKTGNTMMTNTLTRIELLF